MARNKNNPRFVGTYKGVRIDLTAKTKTELAEKIREKQKSIDAGEKVGAEAGTLVRVWAEKWLAVYKKPALSYRSYENLSSALRLHVLPFIGARKLSDIRQYDLQEILNREGDRSYSHVSHIKDSMTGLFRSAYQNELISSNPAIGLKVPETAVRTQTSEDEDPAHRSLTDAEISLFLAGAATHYAGIFFKIMYYCGLRPSEVCALSGKSFKWDAGAEKINVTASVEKGTRRIKAPKTAAGRRTVSIPAVFVPELKDYVLKKTRGNPSRLIFTAPDGGAIDSNFSARWWSSLRRHIDLTAGAPTYRNKIIEHVFPEDLTQYDLRHTYCTNLQRAGVPLNVAKVLMGHSRVETTARIYTHYTEDMAADVRKKLDLFNERPL